MADERLVAAKEFLEKWSENEYGGVPYDLPVFHNDAPLFKAVADFAAECVTAARLKIADELEAALPQYSAWARGRLHDFIDRLRAEGEGR